MTPAPLGTAIKAGYILAAIMTCQPHQAPVVALDFDNQTPRYFNNQPSAALTAVHVDTNFSHGPDEVFTTGGLTRGYMNGAYHVEFKYEIDPSGTQACMALDVAKVTVTYAPEIYIASEHQPGSCDYDQTMQHEQRHLNTDIILLKESMPAIKTAVQNAVNQIYQAGPFPKTILEQKQKDVEEAVGKALNGAMEKVAAARLQRQQLIDTRQEYLRLSAACPK